VAPQPSCLATHAAAAAAGTVAALLLLASSLQLTAAARQPLALNSSSPAAAAPAAAAPAAAAAAPASQPQFDSVFTAAISMNETRRIREAFTAIGSKGLSPELVRCMLSSPTFQAIALCHRCMCV
jgi:hypothetical protein